MFKLTSILAATAIIGSLATVTPSQAGDEFCGYWAFAGAFQSYRNAQRRANNYGGNVLDLDRSNSPNAGKGYHVVAKGPFNSKRRANRSARNYRADGVSGAYAAHRCFYISNNN